jgi:type I site-specific restriction-modification system R (restriction) subunit
MISLKCNLNSTVLIVFDRFELLIQLLQSFQSY